MSERINALAKNEEFDDRQGIFQTDIGDEMQSAYLDYAMSVIVSRALPDVRDGLKPVQRRVVYAMQDQNVVASGKFQKCAAIIGEVMKKYHPHGDTSIYDALVRMGQDFNLRYPLIWPQGNFGSVDGDPPAAMRYTECKLQKISEELYGDIDKETVDFIMNDLQNYEPAYLPSLLPNLLLNGTTGIAVGMATNIPPQNLGEIIDRIIDSFPGDQQDQIRVQLASSLIGVFSQRLIPRITGGLIPAYELMVNNNAVANLIREKRTHEIDVVIETGMESGMIDLNRSLLELVRAGEITIESAYQYSLNPKGLERMI